jgi:hypothetical protein
LALCLPEAKLQVISLCSSAPSSRYAVRTEERRTKSAKAMARGINGGDPHCGEGAVYAAKGRCVSAVIRSRSRIGIRFDGDQSARRSAPRATQRIASGARSYEGCGRCSHTTCDRSERGAWSSPCRRPSINISRMKRDRDHSEGSKQFARDKESRAMLRFGRLRPSAHLARRASTIRGRMTPAPFLERDRQRTPAVRWGRTFCGKKFAISAQPFQHPPARDTRMQSARVSTLSSRPGD